MRSAIFALSLAAVVTACIARPQLEPFEDAEQSTLPSSPGTGPTVAPSADASTADAEPAGEDASTPAPTPTDPPPPPPATTCPPAGAPTGTMCCGANGAAPPCIGMACDHCGDCITQGCAAGMICCAVAPGKGDKYKSMSCRLAAQAGTCPKAGGGKGPD
jgi:hypothetical protein